MPRCTKTSFLITPHYICAHRNSDNLHNAAFKWYSLVARGMTDEHLIVVIHQLHIFIPKPYSDLAARPRPRPRPRREHRARVHKALHCGPMPFGQIYEHPPTPNAARLYRRARCEEPVIYIHAIAFPPTLVGLTSTGRLPVVSLEVFSLPRRSSDVGSLK